MSPEHNRFKVFFREILPSTNRSYRDHMAANERRMSQMAALRMFCLTISSFCFPPRTQSKKRTLEMKGSSLAHLFISSAKIRIFHRDPKSSFPTFPSVPHPLDIPAWRAGGPQPPQGSRSELCKAVTSLWRAGLSAAERLVCPEISSHGHASLVCTQLGTLVSNHWLLFCLVSTRSHGAGKRLLHCTNHGTLTSYP